MTSRSVSPGEALLHRIPHHALRSATGRGNGLGLFLPFTGSEAAFFRALFADDLLRTRSLVDDLAHGR
jgi:hypothetical protein